MGLRTTGMEFATEMVVKATLLSPRWLFLYPGLALMLLGALLGAWLLPASRTVAGVRFDVHTLLYAAVFVLLGFQAIAFAIFTKLFAISEGLLPPDPKVGLVSGALLHFGGSRCIGLRCGLLAIPAFRCTRLCPNHAAGDPSVVVSNAWCSDRLRELLCERVGIAQEEVILCKPNGGGSPRKTQPARIVNITSQ
jgi:hypothetical protein